MMVKAIGSNALFDSGQAIPRALLSIQDNIKAIEDRTEE
jgi:hypothetical protein